VLWCKFLHYFSCLDLLDDICVYVHLVLYASHEEKKKIVVDWGQYRCNQIKHVFVFQLKCSWNYDDNQMEMTNL